MNFWKRLHHQLSSGKPAVLLYVLDSEGSSPGRKGFKMYVAEGKEMQGSIGGGIMEHKLVELARELLDKGSFSPFIKRQIHQTNIAENKSGMICSGEQTVAFYYLTPALSDGIKLLAEGKEGVLLLNQTGVSFTADSNQKEQFVSVVLDEKHWLFQEKIGFKNKLYIIGGGHVGLAFSQLAYWLNFHIILLDNREGLNTFAENKFTHEKRIVNYNEIDFHVSEGEDVYVVLMSFGYKTDEQILKRLIGKKVKYFGVMGSQAKMKTLFENLIKEGYSKEYLEGIHTPIGIPIFSKTPEEIAVSIAAEIIKVKNG